MRALLVVLALIPLTLVHDAAIASDDKAVQEQRREAQKQRQAQKNERNKEIREATKTLREFAQNVKKASQEQVRELDTQFRLQQVDLRTERSAKISNAEADMQQKIMQLMMNPDSENTAAAMAKLRDEMQAHADRVFEIKRQAALQEHQEFIANEQAKHAVFDRGDDDVLKTAQTLGLRDGYAPIRATPYGDGLTTQEERWNEREEKEVERLFNNNRKLLHKYVRDRDLRKLEIANKQEDFELEWQKKAELHAIHREQNFYNLIVTQSASGGEIDQQELAKRATELSKQIQDINRRYANTLAKNRILRGEKKRKIMEQ